jgi:hypothetical protein
VKVAFSDAAANTVSVPAAAGGADTPALDDAEVAAFELDGAAEELAAADELAALVVDVAVVLPELQPTTRVATHSAVRVVATPRKRVTERERLTRYLREFR